MPQSGDGDLWPTTDDDTSPKQEPDAKTRQLPVPDQQKDEAKPEQPAGSWFDTPAKDEPAQDDEKRDEPHAKPEPRVTWPVADLERPKTEDRPKDEERPKSEDKPKREDPATVFSRPLPKQPDEKTAFIKRPAWPAEGLRKTEEPQNTETPRKPETSRTTADAPPSFLRPDNGVRKEPVKHEDAATSFIRRDTLGGPVFSRPEQPGPRQDKIRPDDPPSFTRPTDSTTVNLKRPEKRPDHVRRTEWPPAEPARAAPQRVGPTPPDPEPEPDAPRRRSKKPLLIAAISLVAVVAVAAGVVFGVPGLSDKLGLTGEEPVAIDPPPAPISYSPALHGPDAAAPGPTESGIEQALSGPMADGALGNLTGIVIDPATGEALYEKDANEAITPASTGKILTAAAALLTLDHTEQLVTKVVEGDQPGEVIIVGGGDPTISSLKVGTESIYPGAAHLSELVDQVKASGTPVQTVYIDQSRYAQPGLAASWLPADIGMGYIAPIVPAMLDGDRRDATVNYSPRTTDPGRTLVDEFANRVGASPAGDIEKKAPENAKVLGEIKSAPMTQLVDNMLNRSENTLGDVLAHEVAIKAGDEPSFDGGSKAMLDVLRQNGFNVDGVELRDGSGMSEENKMTARLLAEVLAVAASPDGKDPRTAKLRPLLGGLPVAGGSGTLAERYNEADTAEGKGWVRAKTGSLTGINSLAGVVLDKDNRPLVFAFLTSGTEATSARPALDRVTAALRGCGCQ